MTETLAEIATTLAKTADALLALANGNQAATPTQDSSPAPDLYNPFADYADHIAAVQKAFPAWRANLPSLAQVAAATGDPDPDLAELVRRMMAAVATFADGDNSPTSPTNLPSIRQLAADLDKRFPNRKIGRPKAVAYLRSVYGSCSGDRADKAKNLHNARCN